VPRAYVGINPDVRGQFQEYDGMNRIIAVGTADRLPDGHVYSVFEVL
jgi:hypothetical protein